MAFPQPQASSTFLEGFDVLERRRAQDTYAVDLCRLLGLGGQRRGEEAPTKHADECAPLHHWMISSARCSSDCGIVSPSALAVLRLMTNSNFVGSCTGSSAGFAPLTMIRST